MSNVRDRRGGQSQVRAAESQGSWLERCGASGGRGQGNTNARAMTGCGWWWWCAGGGGGGRLIQSQLSMRWTLGATARRRRGAISDPPFYDVDALREEEEKKQTRHPRYGTPNTAPQIRHPEYGRLTGLVWYRLRNTLDACFVDACFKC